jgi:hypothetical protein
MLPYFLFHEDNLKFTRTQKPEKVSIAMKPVNQPAVLKLIIS